MAGKRLLDAAVFFKASRKIAAQHIGIRRNQLDVWSRTSTVAKAIKAQTDRVTLTAQAAVALAQRINENAPSPTTYTAQARRHEAQSSVPRQDTVGEGRHEPLPEEGLKQDHHYDRAEKNTTHQPVPPSEIGIKQEKPERYPASDGSIPPAGAPVDIAQSQSARDDVARDRVSQPPEKDPVIDEQRDDVGAIQPETSERSTIPDPKAPGTLDAPQAKAVCVQESDDVNTEIYSSPRVAQLLGGRKARINPYQRNKETSSKPVQASIKTQEDRKPHEQVSEMHDLASDIVSDARSTSPSEQLAAESSSPPSHHMHESRVPSSRIGRLWQYGGLATSMAYGAMGETFRRVTGSGRSGGSLMMSAANMDRLVAKLSRMRGAALKLGQMISFQDSKMLPAPIHEVLQRVQDNADYMPASQRDGVLAANLGSEWRSLFSTFDDIPIAAASIGQVHKATLASNRTPVAVKIQYPGVATSINSDLNNISILLTASRLLPKGLFLDKTIANARTELAWECDYEREAACQIRFQKLVADEADIFTVPTIFSEVSGPQVLTAELMNGIAVTKSSLNLTHSQRDWIGTQIMRLALRELTEFNFMQTDPNWTNFLYNAQNNKLELLDFGAARDYPNKFVNPYVSLLIAASKGDKQRIRELSVELGYLTGGETRTMLDAHVTSVTTLAEPFHETQKQGVAYDFKNQTLTDRVRALIPVMIRERLAPPPEETYSLHRKLSGAFLLLARLGSRVQCRDLFVDAVERWESRRASST